MRTCVAATERRSVVVIDSQGDLIGKLVAACSSLRLDAATCTSDLILVDPADVEYPGALNLFDRTAGSSARDTGPSIASGSLTA